MPISIPQNFTNGKTVAILGLGKSGLSVARALGRAGIDTIAWDDEQPMRDRAAAENIKLGDLMTIDWSKIAFLAISPGIPHTHPTPHPVAAAAKAHHVDLICDVEILLRLKGEARLVAISGTNGKSTTTAMIGHVLKEAGGQVAVGGNLGTPALELDPLSKDGIYVLELSSYQLELTPSLKPDIAVLLNISPDHLARHGGMDGYVAAKKKLFDNQDANDTAIIGHDDDHCQAIARHLRGTNKGPHVIAVSGEHVLDNGCFATGEAVFEAKDATWMPVMSRGQAPRLPGAHNGQNIAAAISTCRVLGLGIGQIVKGIASFPGLAHRMELVGEIDGIRFINDSKATNADATARALVCYDRIYWILGGRPKETGLQGLEPHYSRIQHAYLIGEAANDFACVLQAHQVKTTLSGTLDRATQTAYQDAKRDPATGKIVLLSPACASWDQFANFEARGQAFRDTVASLSAAPKEGAA